MNVLDSFHPLISRWFLSKFAGPTQAQVLGWPAIQSGRDTLIAAPTGSGKTLTAFLASLDRLLRLALDGRLQDQTYVVYVSPLRALSNDIQRNLELPLAELLELARSEYPDCQAIRTAVRTGDTSAGQRQQMIRRPPHVLVTTPESLYLLLTGVRSREMLRAVQTVIVDEIHAVARDKRGSHLTLSLERLESLAHQRPTRVGLSATQKPLEAIGQFLVGASRPAPEIVDVGHVRDMDLAVEVPRMELQAVCSHEHWAEIYDRLVQLIDEHRTTLIFVNTRKFAERIAHQLTERLGDDQVLSHHGSLSHRSRHRTEQRLKEGSLRAVVATASLELGIDIGHVDLVCQIGTPRSIATFLQRVGRAGHSLGLIPKGRLFALSREDLMECAALVRAARERRLDRIEIPRAPLDILAQQIVATVACEEWNEDALFEFCCRAYPYRDLSRADFESIIEMLSEGISPRRGRFGAYLHRDRVNGRLRARKGARLTAITCGGAIPEIADYRVVTDEEPRTVVGTLDEDFAIESNSGDIFLLGNSSWRVKHVRGGEVVVSDAQGAPPTIPFWRGEAPGRTVELSGEVGQLREQVMQAIRNDGNNHQPIVEWLMQHCRVCSYGGEQIHNYVASQYAATGMVPTQKRLLFERFFDESGGMQLVVHAPFGTRINRAWGLAMRKRFCRSFDFELQAAADDNGIVLSLGLQHSFPMEQMYSLVPSYVARDVLVQAFLAVPFFGTRWRWNVTRALQLKRSSKGLRVPPQLQRMRAEDLLSAVFPAQTACKEHVVGDIEVPDQPIVRQSMDDCLHEASDLDGLLDVLRKLENGEIEIVGLDSREPSPFAHELLNANPYAFLDNAPLEERRTRAVAMRRTLSSEALRDLGRLDPDAIAQVRRDAWPLVRDADELHDLLLSQGAWLAADGRDWQTYFDELAAAGRAARLDCMSAPCMWVAAERVPLVQAIWPDAQFRPAIGPPTGVRMDWPRDEAIATLVRGRLECAGPTDVAALVALFGWKPTEIELALVTLESEGVVLRGSFSDSEQLEWCDRRLLARIHRLTIDGLRRQIAPVPVQQFVRFLIQHQHLQQNKLHGQPGLLALIEQLEGFEAPAGHWEKSMLPARLHAYSASWLDSLTLSGEVAWGRMRVFNARLQNPSNGRSVKATTRSTPVTLFRREHLSWLLSDAPGDDFVQSLGLSSNASAAFEAFVRHGALFANQLGTLLQLMPTQVIDVLGELAAAGLVTSDAYPGLRTLIGSRRMNRRPRIVSAAARGSSLAAASTTGRWTLLRSAWIPVVDQHERAEQWARLLLRRYGLAFRDLLGNESTAPPWRDLVRPLRRMEARGEIRGGRFVAGVAGEQFALPEAVEILRSTSDDANDTTVILPATDPLNLTGRVVPGIRVPALPGYAIAVKGGSIEQYHRGTFVRSQQPYTAMRGEG